MARLGIKFPTRPIEISISITEEAASESISKIKTNYYRLMDKINTVKIFMQRINRLLINGHKPRFFFSGSSVGVHKCVQHWQE